MKKITKFLLAVLIFTLVAVQFIGCGGGGNNSGNFRYDPTNPDKANMTGTVRVWWGPMDYMKEPLERAITNFNKQYPKVVIDVEYQLHSDYYEQLNLAYMNGTAPDLVRMDHVLLQSLGESRRVIDLNSLTDGKINTMDKDKFLGSSWDGIRIGEGVYGYPFDTNTTLLMYNEVLCKEVFGVETYTPPTTYEELKAHSIAVYNYEKNGKKPYKGLVMAIDAKGSEHDIYVLNGWLSRFGANILSDDRSKSMLSTPEAIEAMEKLYELKTNGAVQYIGYAPTLENEFLYNGTTAFIEMGSWVHNTIKMLDNNGDGVSDVKIAPMPTLKEGVPGYATLGLFGLGITNQCKEENLAATYEFMRYLATDYDAHLDYAKNTNTMPTLLEGQDDEYYSSGENKDFWQAFKNQLQLSLPRPGTMLWPELVTQLKSMERMLMTGKFSVRVTMENSHKLINDMIEEMKG